MPEPFAVLLLQLRQQRGKKQLVFAKELGVSAKTLSRWERGESMPRKDLIDGLLADLQPSDQPSLDAFRVALGLAAFLPTKRSGPQTQAAINSAVQAAAAEADISGRRLRLAVQSILAAALSLNLSLAELQAALNAPPTG